ncbi:alpha/beta hydrolase family protein [Micromonospora sp. NPDC005806]|uniref:alpha/beta hydrolase family protein n=1 Tax=Micromonospora sp. NPDC005806 TaxID=3364234 RepID=UPI0036B4DF7C
MRRLPVLVSAAVLLVTGALVGAGGAKAETPAGPAPAAEGRGDAVLVRDIEIPVPGQPAVRAYLVRPQRSGAGLPGVLDLHWFEPGRASQDRTEFLAEATALAGRGVVSVLPQLTFPWAGDPVGDARDRATVTAQLDAVRQAYRRLLAEPGVDRTRTAVVGHDYGAMYAADLAAGEPGLRTAVLLAPDATWANWFDQYWLQLPAGEQAAYRAVFAGLDPVDLVGQLGAGAYLQFAGADRFVGPETRAAFAAAAPQARVSLYPREEHDLGATSARDDRVAWLADRLGLGG